MITTDKLTKSYGRKPVLRGLSMTALPGDITLLVGENGAGKSTAMRILAGLTRADSGSYAIAGEPAGNDKLAAQSALSYLPQNPQVHPQLSCHRLLRFYARLRGVKNHRIELVTKRLGLTSISRERVGTLSGGTRQRLGIALLLLSDAPVLLLDEPGLSLDPGWRHQLQQILQEEAARSKTILMASHLVGEWNGVAQRCLLCHQGRIARELDPMDLPRDLSQFVDSAAKSAPESKRQLIESGCAG